MPARPYTPAQIRRIVEAVQQSSDKVAGVTISPDGAVEVTFANGNTPANAADLIEITK